ncbi:uncharacterized membrane-anchored protein YjiN (DUF445 family) [Polaromonas sp. CG_9.7]|uniref:DUF445 domain-containing protein n=1 Tax=Polaromonas sp. CG_23.6 TaxID=2760709 RepID=UPI0018CB88B8|nr:MULTISPECIES: DUF445 domain-containing protein [unclassified Polaromonas]MBG6071511.1 uncharacterized membrane-anchored protein YjiN (DUF445 family) [Polaromonas sp. CG_9.7]MBG6113512.1 uncharacterized membrane-anchored protein YjiN (DUF445 family) [Polaromonas sp. CG_9.2]MDH6183029.1 uncharacterized membrane-anchored protein YjiN (DUF445 family) [Polaromonas sp. CG_23.6]
MNLPASPHPRAAPLQRMKLIAVSLLLLALCGLVLAHAMGGQGGWGWLRAFCEASAIGAVADWFAVVALFRHPLGLKIPHTAIIPKAKDRIADGLAEFVRDHFLDPATILAKIAALDPARRLGQWLVDPERLPFWVRQAQGWARGLLETFDDQRLQKAALELVVAQLHRWNAAPTAGDVLGLLTQNGRHHELLEAGLHKLSGYLLQDEVKAKVAQLMLKHARKEWPKIIGTLEMVANVSELADNLADKLSASMLDELRDVLAQRDHPVRLQYEAWLTAFVQRLRTDPELIASVQQLKEKAITDPAVQAYAASLWRDIKQLLHDDLGRDNSTVANYAERGLRAIGHRLESDTPLRDSVNEHLLGAAENLATDLRATVTTHIAQTVKAWDDEQLVRQLELNVGRDLQFIRINGTVVGGLIGLLLHAVVVFG